MMPVNFTLHYDDRANQVDDFLGDVAAEATVGPMYFEPTIIPGRRIPVPDYTPRPTGIAVRRFSGYMDTDGRLKTERGGTVGIRLWANDPSWNLPRFQYRVTANLTDALGKPVPFAPFYFDAPSADIVRNLADELPRPDQKFGRGRPGFSIESLELDDDGLLVATLEDGTELDPTPITVSAAAAAAYAMTFGR